MAKTSLSDLEMPYAVDHIGIYKITNVLTNQCYVGQSQHVRKRIKEHFRVLRLGKHLNPKLQNSYNKYGPEAFTWSMEVECDTVEELDKLENAFLQGDAEFDEPAVFNIANEAKVPMRGKNHSEKTRLQISNSKRGRFEHVTPEYRNKLREGQKRRFFNDPKFVAKVRFLIENESMTYAARGRALGIDTSNARKLALKYRHLKGDL